MGVGIDRQLHPLKIAPPSKPLKQAGLRDPRFRLTRAAPGAPQEAATVCVTVMLPLVIVAKAVAILRENQRGFRQRWIPNDCIPDSCSGDIAAMCQS